MKDDERSELETDDDSEGGKSTAIGQDEHSSASFETDVVSNASRNEEEEDWAEYVRKKHNGGWRKHVHQTIFIHRGKSDSDTESALLMVIDRLL